MAISIEELYDRALALSSDVEDKFLELGRSLRQLLDRDPALFQQVVKKRLGRRKAYYLVEVSRRFEPLPISRARLKKIGWTKLQIIGQHVTKDNVEELVGLAEQLKTKQLERKMRGEEPPDEPPSCLVPAFDGASLSSDSKDALWAKFYMGAPRRLRRSVERYSIVKRA